VGERKRRLVKKEQMELMRFYQIGAEGGQDLHK
jgi:hypothetical protein